MSGCDSFEDDAQPRGEQELDLKESISALPGTSLFIDLKKRINTSNTVKFEIGANPTKGTAAISAEAVLSYVPKADFVSGLDLISLNLYDAVGVLIDSDSIWITMEDSVGNIPCFNGALSDYYSIQKDQPITIYPILNDGYCFSETSGAVINLISEPQHGSVQKSNELFAYEYVPASGFTGHDSFMYELELIDLYGESDFSLAEINIEMVDFQDSVFSPCDSLLYQPILYSLQKPKQESYILPPVLLDPFCGTIGEWDVELVSVVHGSAEITEVGHIKYFPSTSDSDTIIYNINLASETVKKYMLIEFFDGDTHCSVILQANDDSYTFTFDSASIGSSMEPYLFDPAANDVHCFDYSLEIVEFPDLGVAEIISGTNNDDKPVFSYYSDEEFLGEKDTDLMYEICEDGICERATVHLKLIK